MRRTHPPQYLIALVAALFIGLTGCDDQRQIALTPKPEAGVKPGETPPVELNQGPERTRDGSVPLPPATAPTTPGDQNSPGAPVVPLTPPPAASPTEATVVVPPATSPNP